MVKIIVVLGLCLSLGGLVFFTKQPKVVYDQITERVLGEETQSILPSPSVNPISQIEKTLQNTPGQVAFNLKNGVQQALQNGLDNIFGKPTQSTEAAIDIQVTNPSTAPSDQPSDLIDLSKTTSFKISLSKNSKHYLQFQNAPANSCLYIGGNKYPIDNSNLVTIQISNSGVYPLNISNCNLNYKNIGEVEVK